MKRELSCQSSIIYLSDNISIIYIFILKDSPEVFILEKPSGNKSVRKVKNVNYKYNLFFNICNHFIKTIR